MDSKFLCLALLVIACVVTVTAYIESHNEICNRGKSLGSCVGQPDRWMYNPEYGTCEAVQGGCAIKCQSEPEGCPDYAKFNNFNSQSECEETCLGGEEDREKRAVGKASEYVDICFLPRVVGRCRAAKRRWFYNESAGECQRFIWGGCGGNDNKFRTREECQRTCRKNGSN